MNDNQDNNFSKFLPYFGSFVIFLGVVRLMIYYSSFGVNIINFLDFSEIVTSFFDIIVIVVIQFSFSIVQGVLSSSKKKSDVRKLQAIEILKEPRFINRFLKYFSYYSLVLFNGFGVVVTFFIWHFFNRSIDSKTYLIVLISTIAVFIFLVVSFEIEVKHKEFESSDKDKQFTSILLNGLLFFGIVAVYAYNQVESVTNNKSYIGVTIQLDNGSTIVSDSSNYYIGKTEKYLFFYHQEKNRTDVYPIDRIKQLTFGKK